MMGESDEKKPGVPSWQVNLKETTPTEGDAESEPSRDTIVAQAKKFLEEDEVRNASTEKKIAFLESKGLTGAEIQDLLGVTRNTEASSSPSETTPPPPQPQPRAQHSQPYTSPQSQTQIQSTPPIITYPEFLTTPTAPTPLVTKSRLLSTLYLFGGLSALLYGTNTYLITPMLTQLTTSRLSLAETASSNLKTLIDKLEAQVSEIPPQNSRLRSGAEEEEEESEDEDPTELFHRDIGVQTSLPASPVLHASSIINPETSTSTPLESQSASLSTLRASLNDLLADSSGEGQDSRDLLTTISVFREYLDGMAYVVPSYGYGAGGYGGVGGVGGLGKDPDDEIGRVKASIRGVKGVLLSARSFPRGVR